MVMENKFPKESASIYICAVFFLLVSVKNHFVCVLF